MTSTLAHYTWALMLFASFALIVVDGMRWD